MTVATSDAAFDYATAFDRNIGWITADEQQVLRRTRVAIAGMGGVGGVHLLTLARLGLGAFNISALDSFELANFNRDRQSTRLNSKSLLRISYAVFCFNKQKQPNNPV